MADPVCVEYCVMREPCTRLSGHVSNDVYLPGCHNCIAPAKLRRFICGDCEYRACAQRIFTHNGNSRRNQSWNCHAGAVRPTGKSVADFNDCAFNISLIKSEDENTTINSSVAMRRILSSCNMHVAHDNNVVHRPWAYHAGAARQTGNTMPSFYTRKSAWPQYGRNESAH